MGSWNCIFLSLLVGPLPPALSFIFFTIAVCLNGFLSCGLFIFFDLELDLNLELSRGVNSSPKFKLGGWSPVNNSATLCCLALRLPFEPPLPVLSGS